jgi:hypothetical protein
MAVGEYSMFARIFSEIRREAERFKLAASIGKAYSTMRSFFPGGPPPQY